MAYELGRIRTDRGEFLDKGNLGVDPRHPDFSGGARGDNLHDDAAAFADASTFAVANGIGLVVGPGTFKISSNITISAAVHLMDGAKILPDTGVTVTITGPLEAGRHQVFDISAGGVVSLHSATYYPEWWGAAGDGVTDDTAALRAMADAVMSAATAGHGSGVIDLHCGRTYLSGTVDTTAAQQESPLVFEGVNGLTIMGNGATLKTMDSGTPAAPSNGTYPQALLNFTACTNLRIRGLTLNGNRANQLHTIATDTGHNHGIYLDSACADVSIEDNIFTSLGSLRDGPDKRGDGVYALSGASGIRVERNTFRDPGRWGVTLEGGPTTTVGLFIRDNHFDFGIRTVDTDHLGAIDVESVRDVMDVYIQRNRFRGSCNVSFGGSSLSILLPVAQDIDISDNEWDFGAHTATAYDVPIIMSGDQTGSYRTFRNVSIRNNKILADVNFPVALDLGKESCMEDLYVVGNVVKIRTPVFPSSNGGVRLCFSGSLAGHIVVRDNTIVGPSSGIMASSWYDDPAQPEFRMIIQNNYILNTYRSLSLTFPSFAWNASSTAKLLGNVVEEVGLAEFVTAGLVSVEWFDPEQHVGVPNYTRQSGVQYRSGAWSSTAARPSAPFAHQWIFDTTLGKPIWWNGTAWIDAAGAVV